LSASRDQRDELYRKHAAGAFRRALRLLGSDADAAEVVQDVFVSLFERPEQFRGGNMSAFLYSAVTHACLNLMRDQRNRYRLLVEHGETATQADPGKNPEWVLTARAVLEDMPEPLAQVAVYYYLDELSQHEIAEILGCSRRHVGDLLERLARWAERQERRSCNE